MFKKTILLIVIFVALAACRSADVAVTPDPGEVATQIAATVRAELTRVAQEAPTMEPSPTTLPTMEALVTPTLEPQATATQMPLPTATQETPAATATPSFSPTPTIPCNAAEFVRHVTVIPDTSFTPGTDFIKTWRVKNIGACTWNRDYDLVFVDGDRMDSPMAVALNRSVRPGETIDVSVNLEAPARVGDYEGNWVLRNAAGDIFGIGKDGDGTLSAKILVSDLDRVVFDLYEEACSALWFNNLEESLPCPGVAGDPAGYVSQVLTPTLENGVTENEPGLVMHPRAAGDGTIRGRFPEFRVRAGDHFRAVIGCMDGQPDCRVRFELRYRLPGEDAVTLQAWDERFDQKVTKIDIDLTELAGQNVRFVLVVAARGSSDGNQAFWLAPRIVR